MKVKCIYPGPWHAVGHHTAPVPPRGFPVAGNIYTVVLEHEAYGCRWFALGELGEEFYIARRFRPLDEVEKLEELVETIKTPVRVMEPVS